MDSICGKCERCTALYKGKPVVVLGEDNLSSALVTLLRCGDHEDDFKAFTGRRSDLKFPKPKGPEAVYVSQATPAAMQSFIAYLQSVDYRLYPITQSEAQETQAQDEYAAWTVTPQNPSGEQLPPNTMMAYRYENPYPRCWCLHFPYDPTIDYPFSILERGTGGRVPSSSGPVAWLKEGRIESHYAETAELVVRGGLRAFKK